MTNKLKLKESIYILEESREIYHVIFTGTRRIKKFKVDSLVKEIINELKEEKTEEHLSSKLKQKYNERDISDCISSLEHEGIIRKYNHVTNNRNSKQLLFIDELTDSWGEACNLQKKIGNSKIVVFGVGGIGTWMVNSLYQIGIGEIRITDPDKVEESNLNRQLFFDSRDIGKYKVDVIKEKLPDAKIIPFKKL